MLCIAHQYTLFNAGRNRIVLVHNKHFVILKATNRGYRTLPRSLQEVRKSDRNKASPSQSHASPNTNEYEHVASRSRPSGGHANTAGDGEHGSLFNLNLSMGISNLISGGMHFLGEKLGRRKTTSVSASSSPPPR